MGTLAILIALPLLIVFSYIFDMVARKTKFPAVILLMFTGIVTRAITDMYGFTEFGFLDSVIPVLGTIGLILIVLEGALELDIQKEKLPIILKGFLAAALILIFNIIAISLVFEHILEIEHKTALIFAIPLSIISSAVAIPSAAGFLNHEKEFVVYESTFSDILGIMIFNYAIRQFQSSQPLLSGGSLFFLVLQIIGVIIASLIITYLLFRLTQKIKHHVKFFLILALLILVYALGKIFHLPALVTIFIFGLFLGNFQNLVPNFLKRFLDLNQTKKELHEFHILTAESTFLVKTFFFLFFGFSISLTQFNSIYPFLYGVLVFGVMLAIRYFYFTVANLKMKPSSLVYMSPRGLISILLFLQIKEVTFMDTENSVIDERVLLIVILVSMLVMLVGTLKKRKDDVPENNLGDTLESTGEVEGKTMTEILEESNKPL